MPRRANSIWRGWFGTGDVVHDPVVERPVGLKLQRAKRVRDALERVLDRVGKVVHRVDAPLVTLPVMVHVADAVDDGVAHVEVAGGQVDLRAQRAAALGELAVLHALEQIEVFLDRAVAVRAHGGLADVAAALLELLGGQVADVGQAFFDELDGKFIVLFKIIRAVEEPVAPVEAQPVDIGLDGVDVFGVFLRRVGVVHAQVAQAAEFFRPCRNRSSAPCSGRCADTRSAPAETGCARAYPQTGRRGPDPLQ